MTGERVLDYNALVLTSPSHMVVSVVGQLEKMWRLVGLFLRCVPVLCRITGERRVCVASDELVGVDRYNSRGSDGRIYVIREKTFSDAGEDNIIRNGVQLGKIGDVLEVFVHRSA